MDELPEEFEQRVVDPLAQHINIFIEYQKNRESETPETKGMSLLKAYGQLMGLEDPVMRITFDEQNIQDISDPRLTNLVHQRQTLYEAGRYVEAIPIATLIAEIYTKCLGLFDYQVGLALGSLAIFHERSGNFNQARSWFEQALKIYEEVFDPNHREILLVVVMLARLNQKMGDFGKAEALYIQALAIRHNVFGTNNPEYGRGLRELAGLYQDKGDFKGARDFYHSAYQLFKQTLGSEDIEVAITLENAAGLFFSLENVNLATSYLERSLVIYKKVLGPNQPEVGDASSSLATIYLTVGKTNEAKILLENSLTILEKHRGPEDESVANVLNGLGVTHEALGDLSGAEQFYKKAIRNFKKNLGPDHLAVGTSLKNLASLYEKMGFFSKALQAYTRSLEIYHNHTHNMLNVAVAQNDKLFCLRKLHPLLGQFLSLTVNKFSEDINAVRNGFKWSLRCKGMILDEQSRINEIIRHELSEAEGRECEARLSLVKQLANYTLSGPEKLGLSIETFQKESRELSERIDQIDKRLLEKSKAFATQSINRSVEVKDLFQHLPHKTCLVEYLNIFEQLPKEAPGDQQEHAFRTLVFIATPQHVVKLVDLGPTLALDECARVARTAIQEELNVFEQDNPQLDENLSDATIDALKQLYKKIWEPIENVLDGPDRVLVCPDGQLNLIPFAALIDDEGLYLVQKYSLAYLTSGKELAAKRKRKSQSETEFLGIANPSWGDLAIQSHRFKPLPKTQQEIENILPFIQGDREKTVLTGPLATKAALLIAKRPRILHLATHGYFMNDNSTWYEPKNSNEYKYKNLLLSSGLIFSIGDKTSTSTHAHEKGHAYLTAFEVSGMNLSGCDLVVLSACHTGLGELIIGEGVFGLRRAFSLTGAGNLIMSLWTISEEDTPDQMKAFYRYLQNHSPADSLRKAQLDSIRWLFNEMGHSPVGLWASLIVQGAYAFENL